MALNLWFLSCCMVYPKAQFWGQFFSAVTFFTLEFFLCRYGFLFHVYADDTQDYIGFKPEDAEFELYKLELWFNEIRSWMTAVSIKSMTTKQNSWSFLKNICKKDLKSAFFILDQQKSRDRHSWTVINMEAQVTSLSKSAYFQLYNVGTINKRCCGTNMR